MATAANAPATRDEDHGGFFHPYKPGQGFWTRIGTGIGAGLVIAFTVQFLFRRLPVWAKYVDEGRELTTAEVDALRADPTVQVQSVQAVSDGVVTATVSGSHLATNSWPLYVILAGLTLALAALAWWLINRRRHAEFLINTDDEMKKVNWPGRRELVGSTKVVVAFMFFMAGMLFAYDLVFSGIFYAINVMKIPPFYL